MGAGDAALEASRQTRAGEVLSADLLDLSCCSLPDCRMMMVAVIAGSTAAVS